MLKMSGGFFMRLARNCFAIWPPSHDDDLAARYSPMRVALHQPPAFSCAKKLYPKSPLIDHSIVSSHIYLNLTWASACDPIRRGQHRSNLDTAVMLSSLRLGRVILLSV